MTVTDAPRESLAVGLLVAARPTQWVKNVLVVAAPAAAGVLFEADVLAQAAVTFVCFCLVASGTYLLNDALDAQADREHPLKRLRPVAAGTVPVPVAKGTGVALLVAGLLVAAALSRWQLVVVLAVYVATMQAYSLGLKRVPVIEMAVVSSGFVLRAIAGGVATDVEVSMWFLLVTSFSSLFIVAAKRHSELRTLGTRAGVHRPALREYPEGFMEYVGAVSAAVAIMAYCLWALLDPTGESVWSQLSIVPFVLAILVYSLLAARGQAGAPEQVFARTRTLQVLGVVWLVLYGIGVHVGT